MKKLIAVILTTFALALPAMTAAQRTPVVVELFTSEGCSSCPSADALLSDLQKTQPIPGAQIIALGQHVDYWNHGGWADPYSSAQFSRRQNDYAQKFGRNEVYTPQMIVNGSAEFVGSDKGRAAQEITQAVRLPQAHVQATRTRDGKLFVRVEGLPVPGTADVVLAITEDGLVSHVAGGENSGRTLAHSAVVRELRVIGTAQPGIVFTASPMIAAERGWSPARLHAVVFVQERATRRIVGAAEVSLLGNYSATEQN